MLSLVSGCLKGTQILGKIKGKKKNKGSKKELSQEERRRIIV